MARDIFGPDPDSSLTQRVFDILRRRWMLAAAVFLGVLATAAAFAMYLPDLYKAQAQVLVERPVSESVARTPVAGELESRLYIINQEILSRERLTELIERFDLYPDLRRRTSLEDVLNQARQDVVVTPSGPEQVSGRVKTVAFTLSFPAESPRKAADVTNAIATFYIDQNNRMRTEETTETLEVLAKNLADAKQELERQERALRDFTAENAGELPQQAAILMARLETLNTQLTNNSANQRRLQDARDRLLLETGPSSSAIARAAPGASTESVERLKVIEGVRLKLTEALTQFTAAHPTVRQLQEQLDALERTHAAAEAAETARRATEEAAAAVASASAAPPQTRRTPVDFERDLLELRKEEEAIKAQIDVLQSRLESTPGRQQEFLLVNRDYAAAKDYYDSVYRRYQEAQFTGGIESSGAGERFRILDAAVPPEGPSAPNRERLLIVGLLLAIAAAVAAVMLREQLDPSFHSVDEVREFTAVPVLVSIPPIGPAPAGRIVRRAFATVTTAAAIVLVAAAAAYYANGNDQLVRMIAF